MLGQVPEGDSSSSINEQVQQTNEKDGRLPGNRYTSLIVAAAQRHELASRKAIGDVSKILSSEVVSLPSCPPC